MVKKKTYVFVVNPIAGDNDKTEIIEAVGHYANDNNIDIAILQTTGNNDAENILKIFKKHKPERVLVAGGDGTIKMVSEALKNENFILGIVPSGSANGLSVDLNFPKDLSEVIQIAFNNSFMEMDMICLNGETSLHLSDIGLNAELIKNYEASKIRGKLGYAIQSFNTLKDQETPFMVTLNVNDVTFHAEAKMVVIANSQRYGTGVTINPFGKMDDGKFEIIILKNLDLFLFGKIVMGNMPLSSDDVEIISANKATITTNLPVHFQIDGEYFGQVQQLEVNILPKAIKIAVPTI